MKTRVKTGPVSEPIDLTTAKSFLRIDGTDSDIMISSLITAGRTFAEETTGISIASKTYEIAFDCYPPNIIKVPYPNLQSLVSVTVTDEYGVTSSVATTNFVVDTIGSTIIKDRDANYKTTTLREANGVLIEYTAGFSTVPEDIKQAILLYVKGQMECIPPTDWMPSFKALLSPYKVVEI